MKYLLSALLFFCIKILLAQSQNEVFQKQININVRQNSVQDVLDNIEQKTNITFSYNNSTINSDSIISILVFKGKLEDLLKSLLPPETSFILNSNNVIIYNTPVNEKKKIEKKIQNNNKQKIITEKLVSNEDKDMLAINKPVLTPIRPFLIEKIELGSLENHIDTLAIISLSPILVETNNKEIISKNVIDSKKTQKPYRKTVRQNNTNLSQNRKVSTEYSIRPFYQVLKESTQYNNFGIEEGNDKIKDIINSSEENSTSFRAGITATATFDNLKFTSGLAIQKSSENYNYVDAIKSATTINIPDSAANNLIAIPDSTGFSLVGRNIYRYLSVPLFVGYERNLTSNFIISGNIGVWINILNYRSGYYLDLTSRPPYKFNDLKMAPINKIKTDLAVDISLEYKILKNTLISFSTSYMHSINSIFSKNYPVTMNKSAFGYNFALVQKF